MSEFSFNTIQHFDDHISGSINGYLLLDSLVLSLASFWAKAEESVIDLGCTSGRLIHKIKAQYPDSDCIGYDVTDNNFIGGGATLQVQDLTLPGFEIPKANLIICIFTLQFLSFKNRLELIKKMYSSLNPNGALIIAEKEISANGIIQEAFTFANYDYKKRGFTADQILEKERTLRKIMNSLPDGKNKTLFEYAGFECFQFFQSLNFKGWICLK